MKPTPGKIYKVLSVRQPWAWAIMYASKDVENRSRYFSHRGELLIHASAGLTRREYDEACIFIGRITVQPIPPYAQMQRGVILGSVDVAGCTNHSSCSPWYIGPYGIELSDHTLWDEPIAAKGQLGLWEWQAPIE